MRTTASAAFAATLAASALATIPVPPPTSAPLPPYRTAADAHPVGDGSTLPGPGTYTDGIAMGETRTYRVRLDATSNVFLSAVLAPAPGTPVDVVDGIALTLRTPDGLACGPRNDIRFYGDSARPIADYVSRRLEAGRACQAAGEYELLVETVGRDQAKDGADRADPTDRTSAGPRHVLELGYVTESPSRDAPPPPATWSTDPPDGALVTGKGQDVRGGTGFNDAAPLAAGGTWRDEVRPGESRFYRVPVGWGQQLFARARFGNAAAPYGASALPDGLRLAVYNPARGAVDERRALYTGAPATLLLATAPAAYANRTASTTEAVAAMRFAGAYYLQVTLDRRAPGPVPVALDLALTPSSRASTAAGDWAGAWAGAGTGGGAAPEPAPDPTLRAIGIAGVTTGTVLVAGLGAWPVVVRVPRRRPRGRHARQSR
ncbi:hypothetical protein [Streptomyces sp. NPDC048623]|uniref:hypothetical protein n=1 Tax=Streptomyces sp. NPDC048623 TaxID=3155761 RepID=UPI00341A81BC